MWNMLCWTNLIHHTCIKLHFSPYSEADIYDLSFLCLFSNVNWSLLRPHPAAPPPMALDSPKALHICALTNCLNPTLIRRTLSME